MRLAVIGCAVALAAGVGPARAGTDLTLALATDAVSAVEARQILVGEGTVERHMARGAAELPVELMKPPAATRPGETTPVSPDMFALVGQVVDVDSVRWQASETDIVRLMPPLEWMQPFASVALDSRETEDWGRLGFGGGAAWKLGRNASFGTEVILFPSSDPADTETNGSGEMRFLARLQFTF